MYQDTFIDGLCLDPLRSLQRCPNLCLDWGRTAKGNKEGVEEGEDSRGMGESLE